MVFSSIIFLFGFLPVVLAVYHGLRALLAPLAPGVWQPVRLAVLLAFSLVFYGWGEPRWIRVLLVSAGTDFVAGWLIARGWAGPAARLDPEARRELWQGGVVAVALGVNLGLLFFFKYYGFASRHLGFLPALPELALPLGISFYTFKSMSYTLDVYRGRVTATRDPLAFACFVTLFPEMVAGPIVRWSSVSDQLARDQASLAGAAYGVRRFVIGLAKKVLIANTLAGPVDQIFYAAPEALPVAVAWLAAVGYAFQIYFDFSGYSDMAIGLGHLFGFRFPENFDYPYAARSVKDFWRRWHISLSTWFRDYVYIPLGGDRRGPARTMVNLLFVFALCGLWHGASFTFVAWGLWHGAFLLLERTRFGVGLERAPAALRHAYVLLVVMLGWLPFRAPSRTHAARHALALFGLAAADPRLHPLDAYLTPPAALALCAALLCAVPLPWPALPRPLAPALRLGALASLLGASVVALAAGTHDPFIYYRF